VVNLPLVSLWLLLELPELRQRLARLLTTKSGQRQAQLPGSEQSNFLPM